FPVEYEKTIAENLSSLKNLEITKLPNISTFIEKDNSMLESFYKRILALTRMDKKKFGVSLLEVIANIYTIRGQDKQNQTLQNVLTLLSKIKK
ncbi:MAG: hypothetical protein GY870_00875, partial [archaeon]|nr:hypothetical protein [archaeon]